ncbi:MAG: hypothetical protein M0R46_01780 [Candidatus Muirbacterium halophilum]|nr:hypothetical protein [Candidatus Muirbacterium halophilum]MCK9474625.1 hypothetical protein [Candidatus Muirbacterium halophilum]
MSIDIYIDDIKKKDTIIVARAQDEIIKYLSVPEAEKLVKLYISSEEQDIRRNIIEIFIKSPGEQYNPLLIKLFQSEKLEDLKFLISIALGKGGNEKIINHLSSLFARNDFILCEKVLYCLKSIGKSTILIKMIPNIEGQVLFFIKETLKRIDNKKAEQLYNIIDISHKERTYAIFEILGTIRTEENVVKLLGYLKDENILLSDCAEKALFIVGESIAEFLGSELTKSDVCDNYLKYLPEILKKHGPRGIEVLEKSFNLSLENDRLMSAILPYIEFSEEITLKLIDKIPLCSMELKLMILETLSRFGDKASAYFYKTLFTTEDKNVKAILLGAFLLNEKINTNIIKEIYSLEPEAPARQVFRYSLAYTKPGNAFNIYMDMLKSSDYFDRIIAKDIIENMDIKNYKYILESMGTSNTGIGAIIIDIFRKNKTKIKGMLFTYLKEGTDSLKISSAFLIGELKLEEGMEYLLKATKDGNEWVRQYAFKSIENIKGADEAKRLVPDFAGTSSMPV